MSASYVDYIRGQVGHRKIFLAFASVILCNSQGQILLQHRTDLDVWGLPGGVMELGEDILLCARRELREESGLEAGELSLVGVYTDPRWDVTYPSGDQVQQFTVCMAGQWLGGTPQVDGIETRAQAFFNPAEIPWGQIPPWYAAMLQDHLAGRAPAFSPPHTGTQLESQVAVLRRAIGLSPAILVGATGVVMHPDGRLLMVQRSDNRQWTFPGGYCDLGENAAHTAVREIQEETGLQAVPTRLLGVYSPPALYTYPNGDQVQSIAAIFHMLPAGGELHASESETLQAAWKSPAEVLTLDANPLMQPLHAVVVNHLTSPRSFILT